MGKIIYIVALIVLVSTFPKAVHAETIEGLLCEVGDIEFIGTTEKDRAWSFTLHYNFLPNDRNLANAGSGRCIGSGGMVDGEVKVNPTYCKNTRTDGATYMSTGVGGPKGSKGTFFGGTGALAGIIGSYVGGARITLPANEGKFSICRDVTLEYTVN